MIKSFSEWINENDSSADHETLDDLYRLLELGMIDPTEFAMSVKRIDPTGWVKRILGLGSVNQAEFARSVKATDPAAWTELLLKELEVRHMAEPNIWGKPVHHQTPYNTIEFTLSPDMVNMPMQHYNNYGYELMSDEPVEVVIYLGGDSSLELRANYADSDSGYDGYYEEDEDDDEDDDHSYYATWSYNGPLPILTVGDILDIIDGFNDEVDEDTIEDSDDWSHD